MRGIFRDDAFQIWIVLWLCALHFSLFLVPSKGWGRDLGYDLQVTIAAGPNLLSYSARENDAAFRRAPGMLLGIAVHEESAAAESFSSGNRIEPEDEWPVIFGVDWGASDGPVALGNRADIWDVLLFGIVFAFSSTGISGSDMRSVLFEVAGFLRVSPGLALEIVGQSFQFVL